MSIKLISTDFDGTLFAEFENPPVPVKLQTMLAELQAQGAKWVINTGRDLSSLVEALGRSHLAVRPDYLVVVEREIYERRDFQYVSSAAWNRACAQAHEQLFRHVRPHLPRLTQWVHERFNAMIYEDSYSPFCFIAERNEDADQIHRYLDEFCRSIPTLTVVRNDVYARLCHESFNKGTALGEIARQLGLKVEETFAAGDHLNDLPMLSRRHAGCAMAPANAIDAVKAAIREEGGYLSPLLHGHGVADGLEYYMRRNDGGH